MIKVYGSKLSLEKKEESWDILTNGKVLFTISNNMIPSITSSKARMNNFVEGLFKNSDNDFKDELGKFKQFVKDSGIDISSDQEFISTLIDLSIYIAVASTFDEHDGISEIIESTGSDTGVLSVDLIKGELDSTTQAMSLVSRDNSNDEEVILGHFKSKEINQDCYIFLRDIKTSDITVAVNIKGGK